MICTFPCVNCGDHMIYSVEKAAMVCRTCGSECRIENYNMENMTWEGQRELTSDYTGMECPVCGARVLMQEGTAKAECSYCGTEMAAFGLDGKGFSPEKIIPCRLSREQAERKLTAWWMEHDTMPKLDREKLSMRLQDVYVPVWLYNADVITKIGAEISEYQGTEKNGNVLYRVSGNLLEKAYLAKFRKVPFDSSVHIEDALFYDIEPFDYTELIDFNAAFLSGHPAECYHMEPEAVLPRAIRRLKEFASKQAYEFMDAEIGAGEIKNMQYENIYVMPGEVTYALVPVWVCSYRYKGKRHNVFVNGQTGKVSGEVLFTNQKFKQKIINYGISAVLMQSAIMILAFSLALMYNGMEFLLYFVIGELSLLCPLAISAGQIAGKSKRGVLNENVQIRQGMKVNGTGFILLYLLLTVIAGCVDVWLSAFLRSHVLYADVLLLATLAGILAGGIMTWAFGVRLYKYETYIRKSEYYDYAPRANIEVLPVTGYQNPQIL